MAHRRGLWPGLPPLPANRCPISLPVSSQPGICSATSSTVPSGSELETPLRRARKCSPVIWYALARVSALPAVAYSVAQRTTEFGVRLALGAPRAHVLWIAARITLVSAAAGIVIGLAFDSFLGAVLAHWMQNAFAAGSLFAAAALLALSALLACLLPARHAIAVPPAEALRYE